MSAETRSYRSILDLSCQRAWTLEDVLPDHARLDLGRPFLPEALVGARDVAGLTPAERRTLSHVRGHAYLSIFGLVEEWILPFVLDHVKARLGRDDWETRAMLQFASEEAKHIQLFRRFSARFAEDFAVLPVIGPASEIAEAILGHHPLGVGLVVLQIEWMTQRHYVQSVRGASEALDPLFASLLEQHWLEEAQHALLDERIVESIAASLSPADVRAGLADHARIGALLEGALMQQVELDLASFEAATGRELPTSTRQALRESQQRSYRWTFLESGASHPRVARMRDSLARA